MAVFAKKLAAEIGTSNAAMGCPTRNPQPAHVPPTALGPMAELETPYRLLCALRYFMGAALPFIFLWVAIEKGFEGLSYRALACLGAAVLSFVVAVYWYRIIPARLRYEGKELEYLRTQQSFIWVPLPFTFSFIAVARFFDGGSGKYQALGFLAMAVLTFVVGVLWDRGRDGAFAKRWRRE
jgi:hypothetical protein